MTEHEYRILAIADNCFYKFMELESALELKMASLDASMLSADDDDEMSRLLTMYDNVAVIDIKGMLVNSTSFYNRFFGLTSYDEVREAMVQAVDHDAQVVVFDIDSPGGNVAGMSSTADLISSLEQDTISFTSGKMASAAYFLGAQADHVYADSFSEIGSVGVIAKLYDRSKYLATAGIKPMRFRSGDLKAVGDPDFSMTKKERDHVQSQVMNFANKFYAIVSDARGIPMQAMEKSDITSGKTFLGEEALAANLIDNIKSFDEVMLQAFSLTKEVDKRGSNGLSLL